MGTRTGRGPGNDEEVGAGTETLRDVMAERGRLRRLQTITDTLVGELRVDAMLRRIQEALAVDAVVVFEVTEDGTALRHRDSFPADFPLDFGGVTKIGEGFTGVIAGSRKTATLPAPYTGANPQWADAVVRSGIEWIAGVPLLLPDALVGVIAVGRSGASPFTPDDLALLEVAAPRIALALDHENAERRLSALQTRERFLADLTYALTTETQELDALFQVTAERLVQVLGNACKIDVLDGDREMLHMAAFAHRDPAAVSLMRDLEARWPMTRSEGLLATTTAVRTATRVDDVHAFDEQTRRRVLKAEWHEYYTRFPIRSALSVPLIARGVLVGSIIVARDRVEPFSDEDAGLVEEVAARLAPFIANVQLSEERERKAIEARENADRVERLQAITDTLVGAFRVDELIERVRDEFDLDAARLLEVTEDGTALVGVVEIGFDGIRLPQVMEIGEGFTGAIAATRRPQAVAAPFDGVLPLFRKALVDQRFHAFAGVPLLAGDELVGVLIGGRRHPFPPADVEMLQLAASRIALALAHERAERRLDAIAERNRFFADLALDVARAPQRMDAALAIVADRLAERIGELCKIDLVREGGVLEQVAFSHRDPEAQAFGREVYQRAAFDKGTLAALLERLVAGESVRSLLDLDDEVLWTAPEPTRVFHARYPVHAVLSMPLGYQGQVIGLLTLAREPAEPYTDDDAALVEEVAARVAPWVAVVKLYEERGVALDELAATAERLATEHERLVRAQERSASLAAEREAMMRALEASEQRYRRVVEHAPDLIYRYRCGTESRAAGFEYVSPSAVAVLGYEPEAFYRDPGFLWSIAVEPYAQELAEAHEAPGQLGAPITAQFRHGNGTLIWGEVRIGYNRDNEGRLLAVEGILRDVSDVRDVQNELAYRAMHDALTHLPNRHLFTDRLELALARQARTGTPVTMVFVDIDRFKVINDSLGHAAGDLLLASVAERLRASVRPSDTIARMGGDEFAILLDDSAGPSAPVRVAQRVQEMLAAPLDVNGRYLHATVSMGIATTAPGPVVTDRPADLMRHADAALYLAKERGRNRFEVFDEQMRTLLHERLRTESELHEALDFGQLDVHYQPVLHLESGHVLHAEALVRWHHPTRGTLAAARFIAIAEDAGLVVPLGLLVLEQTCRQHVQWTERYGDRTPSIAVNLSDRQLAQPRIVDDLRAVLERTGVDPDRIWFEITESSLIDIDRSARTLMEVRDLGVHLAIDDFGTQYSSLSYLRRYPIEALKIDRSFVDGLTRDPDADAIAAAIVTLGKTLGLLVTAEGVEDSRQLDHLANLGVDFAQGYLIGKPAGAVEFETSTFGGYTPPE